MRRTAFNLCVFALAFGAPLLAGCTARDSQSGPSRLLGYWRAPASMPKEGFGPHLILIRRQGAAYTLWAPQVGWGAPLEVHGNRLVFRHPQSGERLVFSRSGRGLTLADYMRGARKPATVVFTPAQGSPTALAAELHGWQANSQMPGQADALVTALDRWWDLHHRYPSRSALLPGGSFWRWPGAPHLTNAVTGGPMRLGSGAGNFDYSTGGVSDYSVMVHLFGGGDTGQSGF